MTKQEIKDLVAAKIAGQGNQIDLGGALPQVIDAILDAAFGTEIVLPLHLESGVDVTEYIPKNYVPSPNDVLTFATTTRTRYFLICGYADPNDTILRFGDINFETEGVTGFIVYTLSLDEQGRWTYSYDEL